MTQRLTTLVAAVLFAAVFVGGCGKQSGSSGSTDAAKVTAQDSSKAKKLRIAYVEWSDAVASTNVVRVILQEKMGYEVETLAVAAAAMWQAVATEDVDAMVAAWLPTTHGHYYDKLKDHVVDLGPNLPGTRIGLVVPTYVTIGSIPELNDHVDAFDGKIIGIDPGAGIMSKTELALEEYALGGFELIEGSGAAMAATLGNAIRSQEWIVVTGWTPHWMFRRWDLKYLEDPKNVYGSGEAVHTVVRQGLKEDMPEVYAFLDAFEWTTKDIEQLMDWNRQDNADPYENARRWVNEHPDMVESWLSENTQTSPAE